jgi:sulfatase maturation enzyme AslB (radical SAM superfamily)
VCHYTLPTAPRLYTDTNNLLTRQVPAVPGQAPIAEQRTAREVRFHAPLMELNGRPPRHATTSRGLFLLVNTKCDLACSYCFYTTDHEARDDDILAIPTPELIEHLRTLHFGSVILSGGDPLNRASKASTIDLVRELVAGGLQVIVNTSAAFLTDDDCRHLAAARPTRVDISIDSVNTRVHNLLRGRHTDTVAAVRNLVALGVPVQTTTVVTNANVDDVAETVAALERMGVKRATIQPAFLPETLPDTSLGSRAGALRLTVTDELRTWLRERAASAAEPDAAAAYHALWDLHWGTGELRTPLTPFCVMGKTLYVCAADGRLTGCFHRSDVALGNLFTSDADALEAAMTTNELTHHALPPCAGPHCVSLFEGPRAWRRPDHQEASVATQHL